MPGQGRREGDGKVGECLVASEGPALPGHEFCPTFFLPSPPPLSALLSLQLPPCRPEPVLAVQSGVVSVPCSPPSSPHPCSSGLRQYLQCRVKWFLSLTHSPPPPLLPPPLFFRPEGVMAVQGDVGDAEVVRRLAQQVEERFESVDLVINNAGVNRVV